LDQKYLRMIILLLVILCITGIAGTEPNSKHSGNGAISDYTEGGHYDTDYNANFMSEWWYQNGDMKLVAKDGEKKKLAFFVVMTHQESQTGLNDPHSGTQLSHLVTFYGLYPYEGAVTHNYTQIFVPRSDIESYIGFNVPYLDFTYPGGLGRFYGSGSKGYRLNYSYDNVQLNLTFKPHGEKTIDSAVEPVNFTTYSTSLTGSENHLASFRFQNTFLLNV